VIEMIDYKKLAEAKVEQNPSMYYMITFQENIPKETFHFNVRQFKNTPSYQGPTKNGFAVVFEDVYDVERWQKAFNEIFDKAKEKLGEFDENN
jgi:hypothetical protein